MIRIRFYCQIREWNKQEMRSINVEESIENDDISAFNTYATMSDISLKTLLKSILETHENICMPTVRQGSNISSVTL